MTLDTSEQTDPKEPTAKVERYRRTVSALREEEAQLQQNLVEVQQFCTDLENKITTIEQTPQVKLLDPREEKIALMERQLIVQESVIRQLRQRAGQTRLCRSLA